MSIEDEPILENGVTKQPVQKAALNPRLVQLVQALARYAADKDFDAAMEAAKANRASPEAKPPSSERKPAREKRRPKSR